MSQPGHAELARVVRDHAGRLAASLVPLVGDFATAEDLVADAVEAALTHWPVDGIPDRPDGWLYTVARRRGLDLLRRENRHRDKLALVPWSSACVGRPAKLRGPGLPEEPEPDDRARWDHAAIADAGRLIARAAAQKRPGPYQLQAAIVAVHAEAGHWDDTDWTQIVVLYDMLLYLAPSPVTRLHRAIALRYVSGPRAALSEVDELAADLGDYHLFHATRAELLRALGRPAEARAADGRALHLTANPAERSLLRRRIAWT